MDEVKPHNIQPTRQTGAAQRGADRGQVKDPAAAHKWEQALQAADRQLDTVSRQVAAPARPHRAADPAALQDEVRKVNEQLQQMMKAHQNLSRLYHQIHSLDPDKA